MKANEPTFQSVADLGLRDVGVRNEPRRLAVQLGKGSLQAWALIFLSLVVSCVLIRATHARWVAFPLALVWTAALFGLALRSARRSPIVVVKVTARGANRMVWVMLAPCLLLLASAALQRNPALVPAAVLTLLTAIAVRRARTQVPETLRAFQPVLAGDEEVLGDGLGLARGVRRWREAFRLVVATDRRLLVATSPRSSRPLLLVDVPYGRVSRFGIEWKFLGRLGLLSLTLRAADGTPAERHTIKSIAPANLLSIASALATHGVPPDDADVLAKAERAWEDAKRRQRGAPRSRLFDRAAMDTLAFDRGLWLLLAATGTAVIAGSFGSSATALVVLCAGGVAGYVSGTKASLAYLVPFNLLLCPAFVYMFPSAALSVMIGLSTCAGIGLWVGAKLSARRGDAAASTRERRPARGSLRYTIGGLGLLRISRVLLVTAIPLVLIGSAAGIDVATLHAAFDEATARQLPVDGASNLTGGGASVTYTPTPNLHELVTDRRRSGRTGDGARWELRSSWTSGFNVVSLSSYIEQPRLDDPAAVARFVASKDREHARLAGYRVTHAERVIAGRRAYVWRHGSRHGYWYYAAWFPRPGHTVRVECIAKKQVVRFKRLCAEAIGSLEFDRP